MQNEKTSTQHQMNANDAGYRGVRRGKLRLWKNE